MTTSKKSVFRMHVLAAGHGDCLWVDFGDPDMPTRILVDAGTTGTFPRIRAALDLVRGSAPSHAVLMVTHVDADHIGGALKILEDRTLAAQFHQVWFNGRRHLTQAAGLQAFGAVQGERLTSALLEMPGRWNTAFAGGAILRPSTGAPPSWSIGEATVTILGPTEKELAALLPVWDQEVIAAGLKPHTAAAKGTPKVPGWQSFGQSDVNGWADTVVAVDTAPANGSSIAALIEYQGARLLLGADAHPQVLLDGIRGLSPSDPLTVDVWKLPHHGSAANVTDDLLAAVNATTVVFSSNGAYFSHPDRVAVARVVRRYRNSGVHLVFNYKTTYNQIWASPSLQAKWNYTAEYGKGLTGVSLHII